MYIYCDGTSWQFSKTRIYCKCFMIFVNFNKVNKARAIAASLSYIPSSVAHKGWVQYGVDRDSRLAWRVISLVLR